MSTLIVAAHPDDEALGCGGTMRRLADAGEAVDVLFVADGVGARGEGAAFAQDHALRRAAAEAALKILGVRQARYLDFRDNRLDSYDRLDIVQAVEQVVSELRPQVIYTHHAGDLNIDHVIVNQAVMTACRPQPGHSVREIYAFEVLSSTEWQAPSSQAAFIPNVFCDISQTLEAKLAALSAYTEEMRAFPHSRSLEGARALATYRGVSIGVFAAEALMALRIIG